MDLFESVVRGFAFVLEPTRFLFMFLGVAGGIVVGALPGLTGSVGIILLLPFVLYVDPNTALVMMCGMFCGSMYGGSISAILISTPGTPSAAATVLDGYPMALKGEAGKAIGVATVASATGGIISTFCLMLIAPQLAHFALEFGPEEYFALMVFGLTIIASVAGRSLIKGLIAGVFGLMIAVVGIDPVVGYDRYSFGIPNLMTGFPLLPVLIGLFAIPQVFLQMEKRHKAGGEDTPHLGNLLPTTRELLGLMKTIVPASLIGTLIGVIPGTGGAIASFLAYNEARRFSKHPEKFGTGCMEGVAAPEAANNGTTGGAMVPTLTLGIPGDVVTAVMLGALMLIGVRPGPLLFKDSPQTIDAVYAGMLMSNVLILLLGFLTVRLFPKILRVPSAILFPLVLALCFVGSFSLSNSTYDMAIALIFGIIGLLMRKFAFPAAPVVLGVILGPIAEDVLGRALITSHGDWATLVTSPIALFFYAAAALSVMYSVRRQPDAPTDQRERDMEVDPRRHRNLPSAIRRTVPPGHPTPTEET